MHKAGAEHGLRNAGYRAIETLRLEKGYRAWSSDIGPDHTPDEAGLGWAVKLKSNIPFKGREAVQLQKDEGVQKTLATFTTDDPETVVCSRSTIFRNGERVGYLSSAGFGYTLNQWIGYGYVRSDRPIDAEYVLSGDYEVEVATRRVPCKVHLAPLYDPKMERVKC